MYYPIFLDLREKKCLIVGAGQVGQRKLRTLLKFKPKEITLVDPNLPPNITKEPNLILKKRGFKPSDLEDKDLVFACTSNPLVNQQITQLAKAKKIWVNSATNPKEGDFSLPSLIEKEPILIAISTQGESPALTKLLKDKLDKSIGREYVLLANLLGRLRPIILANLEEEKKRQECFRKLAKALLPAIKRKDRQELKSTLLKILPFLKTKVGDIIDEFNF